MNYNQRGRLEVEKPRPDDMLTGTQPWSITRKNFSEAQRSSGRLCGGFWVPVIIRKGTLEQWRKKWELYIADEHLEGGISKGESNWCEPYLACVCFFLLLFSFHLLFIIGDYEIKRKRKWEKKSTIFLKSKYFHVLIDLPIFLNVLFASERFLDDSVFPAHLNGEAAISSDSLIH